MGVSTAHAILSPCCKHFFTMTSTPRVDSPSQRRDRWSIPASSLNHSAFNSISSQIWSHRLYGTSPAEEKPQDINKRTANESYILSGNTVIQERPRRRDRRHSCMSCTAFIRRIQLQINNSNDVEVKFRAGDGFIRGRYA